jgi:hypothetical protein
MGVVVSSLVVVGCVIVLVAAAAWGGAMIIIGVVADGLTIVFEWIWNVDNNGGNGIW